MKSIPDINSLLANVTDRRKSLIYDRVNVPSGFVLPSRFYLFQIPLGQPDQFTGKLKTPRDTNMILGGMLPAPWGMILLEVSVLFQPSVNTWTRDRFIATHSLRNIFLRYLTSMFQWNRMPHLNWKGHSIFTYFCMG